MDGLFNSGPGKEHTTQVELSRHRLLRINLSSAGLLEPADASSFGVTAPSSAINLGPHFVLSSLTPDNSHCYGFEFFLTSTFIGVNSAVAPYTVTIWELIGNSITNDAFPILPIWASLLPVAGILNNELFHTFDVNACAIRFQIVDTLAAAANRSIIIGMAEL